MSGCHISRLLAPSFLYLGERDAPLILEGCCRAALIVVFRRAAPLGVIIYAMANETWKFIQSKNKNAMKQVLGIKNEAARMKVTPPLAVPPHVHGDDMRCNPNDNGINFNP